MADDQQAPAPAPAPIHVNHWCDHPGCKEWGAFGYDNKLSGKTRWFCYEHRPDARAR